MRVQEQRFCADGGQVPNSCFVPYAYIIKGLSDSSSSITSQEGCNDAEDLRDGLPNVLFHNRAVFGVRHTLTSAKLQIYF